MGVRGGHLQICSSEKPPLMRVLRPGSSGPAFVPSMQIGACHQHLAKCLSEMQASHQAASALQTPRGPGWHTPRPLTLPLLEGQAAEAGVWVQVRGHGAEISGGY